MVSWISKNNIISTLVLFSFLISDDIYLSKIEIEGIVTATKNQIYRNIGLFPSESFDDFNKNGIYDIDATGPYGPESYLWIYESDFFSVLT